MFRKCFGKPHIVSGFFLLLLVSGAPLCAENARGEITGGVAHEVPDWFKESFLEISDDVDEANEDGKHVLLFFQLNNCPYCDRMLTESFESESLTHYIQRHFDSIAINVGGDREIAYNDNLILIEKQLAELLKVRATPAIVFLSRENREVIRVNGYRAPERFKEILKYVATEAYKKSSIADYLDAALKRDVYQLDDSALIIDESDLSGVTGPMMVIFEDGSCYDCYEFHNGILKHQLVLEEIKPFTVVRLNTDSNINIVDVDGTVKTPKKMAEEDEMMYRPGVLVFDNGKLIRRHDSLLFPFHFKESLRFVSGKFYDDMPYKEYYENRTEQLLSSGITIDYGRAEIR